MPKIYLCPEGPNRICTIISKEDAESLIKKDPDWDVYVLDVERYDPTPPKETRWVVVDENNTLLSRENWAWTSFHNNAVSFYDESDALRLLNALVIGGMTGLSVRKIKESE